ncbi:MAG: hypothetical protein M3R69_11300 [Acidobacteriota bacterium]|nr:hypothetical protein [Acidobacteriota bacterium]
MNEFDPFDQEPQQIETSLPAVSIKERRSFSKLRRELSDDELLSPAIQRMLLDEIERLDKQVSGLENYRKGFYESDKRAAVLEQKVNRSLSSELIFGVCLCVGAASLGYAPAVWKSQPSGYLAIAFGVILIIGGTLSRLMRR